jgi:hypothetical protein
VAASKRNRFNHRVVNLKIPAIGLEKVAFAPETGVGKKLLMYLNILQYI